MFVVLTGSNHDHDNDLFYLFVQEVNGNQRDEAVRWMLFLNRRFGFTPETFGLSVSLLDRFHCLVKVSLVKWFRCSYLLKTYPKSQFAFTKVFQTMLSTI